MRDLTTEELGFVYGAGGKGRGDDGRRRGKNSKKSKKSRSKKSKKSRKSRDD